MAELLVRASGHWMDGLTAPQVAALTPKQLEDYNARSQIGDIIVVKPDGWVWGNEEKLPNYIIVKLPGIPVSTVEHYQNQLLDVTDPDNPKLLKRRKHRVPPNWLTSYITANQSIVEIAISGQQNLFRNNIIIKTS